MIQDLGQERVNGKSKSTLYNGNKGKWSPLFCHNLAIILQPNQTNVYPVWEVIPTLEIRNSIRATKHISKSGTHNEQEKDPRFLT